MLESTQRPSPTSRTITLTFIVEAEGAIIKCTGLEVEEDDDEDKLLHRN